LALVVAGALVIRGESMYGDDNAIRCPRCNALMGDSGEKLLLGGVVAGGIAIAMPHTLDTAHQRHEWVMWREGWESEFKDKYGWRPSVNGDSVICPKETTK
jgi:hypothetical protein